MRALKCLNCTQCPLLPRMGIKWGSGTPSHPCSWGPSSPGPLPPVLLTTAQPLPSDQVPSTSGHRGNGGDGEAGAQVPRWGASQQARLTKYYLKKIILSEKQGIPNYFTLNMFAG